MIKSWNTPHSMFEPRIMSQHIRQAVKAMEVKGKPSKWSFMKAKVKGFKKRVVTLLHSAENLL